MGNGNRHSPSACDHRSDNPINIRSRLAQQPASSKTRNGGNSHTTKGNATEQSPAPCDHRADIPLNIRNHLMQEPGGGESPDFKHRREALRVRLHTQRVDDAYYIGDAYEPSRIRGPSAGLVSKRDPKTSPTPYLDHIDYLTGNGWPQLRYLADFMRVTTSPPLWKYLSPAERKERASRVKIALLVFNEHTTERFDIGTVDDLELLLKGDALKISFDHDDAARMFVVEDPSTAVIETLGGHFDIDPMFFRGHISDYIWYNIRDPWIELPSLDLVSREQSHHSIRYRQTRFFRSFQSLNKARDESNRFNVLRRIDKEGNMGPEDDSTTGTPVGIVRSKMSCWIQPESNKSSKNVTGVLLVDPSVTEGHPIWGGYNNLIPCPSIHSTPSPRGPRHSVFEETIYWLGELTTPEVRSLRQDPWLLLQKPLSIVCSEWILLIKYANTRFSQLEWEVEDPQLRHHRDGLAVTISKLHTWRRRFPIYKVMVSETLEKMVRRRRGSLQALEKDFVILLAELDTLHERAEKMMSVVTAVLSIEESQKALQQNRSLGRLTYLAALFVPLSFISSFFSMNDDITRLHDTFWIYFVVAIPMTLLALLVTRYSRNLGIIFRSVARRVKGQLGRGQ